MMLFTSTWKVRNLQRSVSLKTVATDVVRFRVYLLSVREVRRDKGGVTGESDAMRPLGGPRCKRNYNINMDIKEVG